MKIDARFDQDAHKTLKHILDTHPMPPVGTWIWLEPNKVRLYVFDDCVEFQTSKETLQIGLHKVKETA